MPETAFALGAKVDCTDGPCGVLHTLVVRPAGPQVTHLVVEPEGRIGLGRLVPVELVASSDDVISLSSDLPAFNSLPMAESSEVVEDLSAGYIFLHATLLPRKEVHEVLPEGEEGLGSATQVLATDGAIGGVGGLITTGDSHEISSVIVTEERHLWGHKLVVIPVGTVAAFSDDGVQLNVATADAERVAVTFQR
jgi:hypothetical protein